MTMNKREKGAFIVMQNTLLDALEKDLPKQLIKERVERALIMSATIIEPSTKANSGKPRPR